MNLLVIDAQNAPSVYREAGKELKKKLEEVFGKKVLTQKITDRIKTFEDACNELGIDPEHFVEIVGYMEPKDELAYRKLKVIVKALNEGWEPNWNDSSERKWRPWFYLDAPGFRFHGSDYVDSGSISAGGSRLCFKSEELCNYAAQQFLDIYKDLYN
jgi:hypothetical protein